MLRATAADQPAQGQEHHQQSTWMARALTPTAATGGEALPVSRGYPVPWIGIAARQYPASGVMQDTQGVAWAGQLLARVVDAVPVEAGLARATEHRRAGIRGTALIHAHKSCLTGPAAGMGHTAALGVTDLPDAAETDALAACRAARALAAPTAKLPHRVAARLQAWVVHAQPRHAGLVGLAQGAGIRLAGMGDGVATLPRGTAPTEARAALVDADAGPTGLPVFADHALAWIHALLVLADPPWGAGLGSAEA